ncbi:hypothetical protein [Flavivirga jejuensis]|uniref:Uncharacterized protein n=1 Tax=Flavivirga jejuensis TaxID=870487 RepID=A0ABT8WMI8_9FLAO|nr:hypothetical protein [Flavivirga jejuensis]MDO5974371.1 hypothetical protein [Flavivirga jejuensis]
MMTKYIITGDTGFIRSHITETLHNQVFLDTSLIIYGVIKHAITSSKKFKELGFKPDYTLQQQGLEATISYNQLIIKQ